MIHRHDDVVHCIILSLACGGENYDYCAASPSLFFVNHYLHHGPPRPHTRPRTHKTPLHATTLHSNLPLYSHHLHTHTFQHIIFCKYIGSRFCVRFFVKGAHSMVLFHIHITYSIDTRKHPTPTRLRNSLGCIPVSPHQRTFVCRACTGTAQVGVSLVSLLDLLSKRSRSHCLDVCFT